MPLCPPFNGFVAPMDVGVGLDLWQPWAVQWYATMATIATVNIALYVTLSFCATCKQCFQKTDETTKAYKRRMRLLAGPYVFVCAYRSYLPNQYPQRYVFFDTFFSSILLMRSLAAIGEMCFISQIAYALAFCDSQVQGLKQGTPPCCSGSRLTQAVAKLMVVVIFVAQGFSFAGTITESNLWYVYEEACWGFAFLLGLPAFVYLGWSVRSLKRKRAGDDAGLCAGWTCAWNAETFAILGTAFSAVYVPYMFGVDVPTYYNAYLEQVDDGVRFFGFWEGLQDALFTRRLTHSLIVWEYARVWMGLYFSLAVWMSIALAIAPRPDVEAVQAVG